MLTATWNVLLELSPWLLLGMTVAGALHGLVPPGFLEKHLRGKSGVLRAVLLGVPLPLCSCSVIPTGIGLKKDGASDGAAIGFLISTPQTGVDSILVTASFLGWPFAIFKMFSAAVTGLIGGMLTERKEDAAAGVPSAGNTDRPRPSLRDMTGHALSIVESIWGWLAFGILASAAISTYVPNIGITTVEHLGSFGALFAVLLVSVPLYVCATASVPIAAALVAGGMPTGAALVFLMAGPATNIATIGAVHRAFGARTLSIYLGTIIGGSVSLALLFDTLFVSTGLQAAPIHEHSSPLGTGAALILLAMMFWFAVADIRQRLKPSQDHNQALPKLELNVAGMTCGGCVRKLTAALSEPTEVISVDITLEPGRAIIYGQLEIESARKIIRDAGFESH